MQTIWVSYDGLISDNKDCKIINAMKSFGCERVGNEFSLTKRKRSLIFEANNHVTEIVEKIKQQLYEKHKLQIEIVPF